MYADMGLAEGSTDSQLMFSYADSMEVDEPFAGAPGERGALICGAADLDPDP